MERITNTGRSRAILMRKNEENFEKWWEQRVETTNARRATYDVFLFIFFAARTSDYVSPFSVIFSIFGRSSILFRHYFQWHLARRHKKSNYEDLHNHTQSPN